MFLKNFQNEKFLRLDKTFISCHLALFMALKTKTASFHDLTRTLFLVLLLPFWLKNQNSKFLYLDKAFVPCSFTWFMAIKFEMGLFWNLLTKMGVYLFLFMVLISKRDVSITQEDVQRKIGMSNEITLKSEFFPDNVWTFKNSYFATRTLSKLRWHKLKECENWLSNVYKIYKQIWKVYILEIRRGH